MTLIDKLFGKELSTRTWQTLMNSPRGSLPFALVLACAAVFVLVTSDDLPALVAAHFDAAGVPNGFMPRSIYVTLTLFLVVGVPILLVLPLRMATARPAERLNLPNKAYWLAPERRENTVRYLIRQARFFACCVALFLVYVHWLVVVANTRHPAQLAAGALLAGLTVFLVVLAVWVKALLGHFRRAA